MSAIAVACAAVIYVVAGAAAFAVIDGALDGRFSEWYDDAPAPFLRSLLWIGWPVVAFIYWREWRAIRKGEKP